MAENVMGDVENSNFGEPGGLGTARWGEEGWELLDEGRGRGLMLGGIKRGGG